MQWKKSHFIHHEALKALNAPELHGSNVVSVKPKNQTSLKPKPLATALITKQFKNLIFKVDVKSKDSWTVEAEKVGSLPSLTPAQRPAR